MIVKPTELQLTDADVQGFMQKIEKGGQDLTPGEEIIRERLLAQAESEADDDTGGFVATDSTLQQRAVLYDYARFGGLA